MNRLILFNILFFQFLFGYSQDILKTNIDTIYHDTIIKTDYFSDETFQVTKYTKNELISQNQYFKNGNPLLITEYFGNSTVKRKLSAISGMEQVYYSDGQLKYENFVGLRLDRNKIYFVYRYFDINGIRLNIGDFSDGDGTLFIYDDYGTIVKLLEYKNGSLTDTLKKEKGGFTLYNKRGFKKKTYGFKNKKQYSNKDTSYYYEDIYINKYHNNGTLKNDYHTDNWLVPQGIEKEYYKNGNFKLERKWGIQDRFKIDERVLIKYDCYEKSYFSSGKIKSEGRVKDGFTLGKWLFYNKNGEIKKEVVYNY